MEFITISDLRKFFKAFTDKAEKDRELRINYHKFKIFTELTTDYCRHCDDCCSTVEGLIPYKIQKIEGKEKIMVVMYCASCSRVIYSSTLTKKDAELDSNLFHVELAELLLKNAKAALDINIRPENPLLSIQPNKSKIEGDRDMNTNKMFKGFDFGVLESNNVRISHLGIAVENRTGTFVSYDKNNEELVDVDLFDINLEGMIYKMPVALKDIKTGDAIIHNNRIMIVTEAGSKISVIDPAAGEEKKILPTKSMFGFNFYTKVTSLVDFSSANASSDNPFGNLMPLMLMSGKGKSEKSNLMPLMLMSMMNGGNAQSDMFSNPMMMMMLMSDNKEMGDILPMMMLMGGNNPFAPKKEVKNEENNG